jgi:3-methyladenine DNA glycosylase AlkD
METIIEQVLQELKNSIDEKTLNTAQNFFKKDEPITVHGVKMPAVARIAKEFFQKIKGESKPEIFSLCEKLWQSEYLEESVIACEWAYSLRKQFEPNDFETFERWVQNYVNNWASCDTLCNHTIGEFPEIYPEYLQQLKKWATSQNRWMRRAAAVSLIIPVRKGIFFDDILQIATILLHDKDDLVQKGYGWMLKAASQARQKDVFDFIIKHKATMPRTALRYAIEKMPATMKTEAMKK